MFARYKTSISTIATIFAVLLCFSDVVALDLRPTTSPFLQTGTDVSLRVQGNVCIGTAAPLDALSLCTSPVADATRALFNISNTALSGGSASGTFVGGNPAACAGDFLNFQLANADRTKLTCAGALTVVSSTNNLSIFAATTSAQLAGVLSNETGSGLVVFNDTPTLIAPLLGTPTSGVATNITGLPLTTGVTGVLPVVNGGTGVTTSTGTTNVVLSGSPTVATPTITTGANGTQATIGTPGYLLTYTNQHSISARATLSSGGAWTAQATSAGGIDIIADGTTGILIWYNTGLTINNTFSPTTRLNISPAGVVNIANLAGVGSRAMCANASGDLIIC